MLMSDEEKKDEKQEGWSTKLLETRQVFLTGSVNTKSATKVIQELLTLEADDGESEITLWVNSPGGSVNDGYAIYDTIRFLTCPVRIIASGLCASIATIVLIAAEKSRRFCTPNTRLLIHQPLIPMEVYGPASDLEITASEILKTREKINEMLAEACGHPTEKLQEDTQRDYWMTAEVAKAYGLVTHIVSTRQEVDALTKS
jgi:ATP-dependent Clp protease, protease subunit